MWVIVRSKDRGFYKTSAFKLSHYPDSRHQNILNPFNYLCALKIQQ